MPVKISNTLPARAILEAENVFVMGMDRAEHQDIRPLQVAILNLMPTKIATETQLLRLLGNSSLQEDVTLLHTVTHEAKNTDADHLLTHYESLESIRDRKFDGLVITGAPVEHVDFYIPPYHSDHSRFDRGLDHHIPFTLLFTRRSRAHVRRSQCHSRDSSAHPPRTRA